jgi:hypothetical protein
MGYIIDGPNKVIKLTSGTTSVSIRDLWSRWVDWFLTGDNSKYLPAFVQTGGDAIDPSQGTAIPIYIFLMNGWKLQPQEAHHTLSVNDGIIVVNGGGDPFINTTGAYTVRINYSQPVQAITVNTAGASGGLTSEESAKLDELWKLQGFKPGAPMIVDDVANTRSVDGIILDIAETTTTLTVTRR